MKADRSNTQTFPASIEQYTTHIDSHRPGEDQLPVREALFPTESTETVKLLRSLTPYTSNRSICESFFTDGEQTAVLHEPANVDTFLERYQAYDQRLMGGKRQRFALLQLSVDKFYVGEVFNGKCHGAGVVVFRDGRLYEGLLENNIRQGQGLFVLPDKSWFYGEFSNDKKDGFGTELNSRYRYQGQYVNGMKHGNGVLVEGSTTYIGEWQLGLISGRGILDTSESRYEGQFTNFKKHGVGKQLFKNGDEYSGPYWEGKPHGQGEYHWSQDQCHFIGNFLHGQRCGKGEWISAAGDRYAGNYESDLKSGYGQFYWRSGNVYKGNYKNDLRHGYGEMYWRDGAAYKGEWKNGIQHGRGTMIGPGQQIITGIFDENVLVSRETALPNQNNRRVDRSKSHHKESFRKEWKRVDSTHQMVHKIQPFDERLQGRTEFILAQRLGRIKEKSRSKDQFSQSNSKGKFHQSNEHIRSPNNHSHSKLELSPGGHHRFCRACAQKEHYSAIDLNYNKRQLPAVRQKNTTGKKLKSVRPDSKKKSAMKFYMRYQAAQYLKFKF